MAKKIPAVPDLTRNSCEDLLAQDYLQLRDQLREASKDLHDHTGSQLAAAGLRLQLLSMETSPDRSALVELEELLAGAMESVREVSKRLSTSPVRPLGFKGAIEELTDRHGARLKYETTAAIPPEIGERLYHLVDLVLGEIPSEGNVSVRVSGVYKLSLIIKAAVRLKVTSVIQKAKILSKSCGFSFFIEDDQVTIVSIEYAIRRVSR